MTSNGFEKFYGYPKNTSWIKIFLFAYVYVGLFGYAAYVLNKLSEAGAMAALTAFLQNGVWSYWIIYMFLSLGLWLTIFACAVFLPMIGKTGYVSVAVHLCALMVYRPLLLLFTWLNGSITKQLILSSVIMFVICAVFGCVNMIYFSERKDLFYASINELIMGEPKDINKH